MARMRRFGSIEELRGAVGTELGPGGWVRVTQDMIDAFASATGDFQWIHVDRERAKRGPYGTTIAHGFLTLSLMARLRDELYDVDGVASRINYGCDKVRFLTPVPAEGRVRMKIKLAAAEPMRLGLRLTSECTFELEGASRPALVAEQITILVPP
jgi:acyl dehydratase